MNVRNSKKRPIILIIIDLRLTPRVYSRNGKLFYTIIDGRKDET